MAIRRTFVTLALIAATLASGGASLAQPADPDQQQQQYETQPRYEQQREDELRRARTPHKTNYVAMANGARLRAEHAKTPEQKAKFLKMAEAWDRLAEEAAQPQ